MTTLLYLVTYVAVIVCLTLIAKKVRDYLKKPVHLRWELYPVAHEPGRASYGGSYLEDVNWWKSKPKTSFIGGTLGLMEELLLLHSTFHNNLSLWLRTYPFHLGLYLLLGAIGFGFLAAFAKLFGYEDGTCLNIIGNLGQVMAFGGFCGVFGGAAALLHRRLTKTDLRKYSTPEHYFNLGAFIVFSGLGILTWLFNPSFFNLLRDFFASLISFSFEPIDSSVFMLFAFVTCFVIAYIPATHMAHFFMKYFLYHDIRWGDEATMFNKKTQDRMNEVLGYPVSWKAPHIKGDGKKNWGQVATTNPTDEEEKK